MAADRTPGRYRPAGTDRARLQRRSVPTARPVALPPRALGFRAYRPARVGSRVGTDRRGSVGTSLMLEDPVVGANSWRLTRLLSTTLGTDHSSLVVDLWSQVYNHHSGRTVPTRLVDHHNSWEVWKGELQNLPFAVGNEPRDSDKAIFSGSFIGHI